ncbi:hypothetical protein [Paraburkholderia sp. J8-2]|uniref:hypothetical protein n=1 Tax=Paraburkholderia sp. J8-2 TaxID=2805440 RepID=UPI002AB5FE52|nr:hypothetical protein [Paraburkholderia sp. J8-2]
MSAKRAAAALVEFDSDTRAEVEALAGLEWDQSESARLAVILDASATWTLSLAAAAAGVDEAAVLVALARDHLGYRTQMQAAAAVRRALEGAR